MNMDQLVIPKHHGAKLTDIPDDHLMEILVSLLHHDTIQKLAQFS